MRKENRRLTMEAKAVIVPSTPKVATPSRRAARMLCTMPSTMVMVLLLNK